MSAPKVGILSTCLVQSLWPNVLTATRQLLELSGAEVSVPRSQTCCGQVLLNSGDVQGARALWRKLARDFEHCDFLVAPSGSCLATLTSDGARLEPELAELAQRSYELSVFLTRIRPLTQVPGRLAATVTYHDSCSGLRTLGIKTQPRQLLSMVAGLRLVEMLDSEQCCGFGGAFAVKFAAISSAIGEKKVRDSYGTEAEFIAGGDVGCLLHLQGKLQALGLEQKVYHYAEILAGLSNA